MAPRFLLIFNHLPDRKSRGDPWKIFDPLDPLGTWTIHTRRTYTRPRTRTRALHIRRTSACAAHVNLFIEQVFALNYKSGRFEVSTSGCLIFGKISEVCVDEKEVFLENYSV